MKNLFIRKRTIVYLLHSKNVLHSNIPQKEIVSEFKRNFNNIYHENLHFFYWIGKEMRYKEMNNE